MNALRLVIVACALLAGCWVHDRTGEFECSSDTSCHDGRVCDKTIGYCVVPECPSDCTSCDLVQKTCMIACSGGNHCNSVECPAGYACTIQCSANNACDNIDCSSGRSCSIQCSATNACNDIQCGDGPCTVSCTANNSCGNVACSGSCKCDVGCTGANCPATTCPINDTCTADGTAGTTCVSSKPGCTTC